MLWMLGKVGRVCRTADRISTPLNSPRAERNCVPLMHHFDCWPATSRSVRLSADSVHDTVTHVAHFICLELCPNYKAYKQWCYFNWHNKCETVLSCRLTRTSIIWAPLLRFIYTLLAHSCLLFFTFGARRETVMDSHSSLHVSPHGLGLFNGLQWNLLLKI